METAEERKERISKEFRKLRGGIYVPPHRMRELGEELQDEYQSQEYQRIRWTALRKSINGKINKISVSNIKDVVPDIFRNNLFRGKGLFVQAVLRAQHSSPLFSNVFAATVVVVNSKLPDIGLLLISRLFLKFQKAVKRNDKVTLFSATRFIAHLVNQQVLHEVAALQILTVLLEAPTNDSVEIAVAFTKECGEFLSEVTKRGVHTIFERFRAILQEGMVDFRTQFLIESLFAVRKAFFSELDLVSEQDKITHEVLLDDKLDEELHLDFFKYDEAWKESENKWKSVRQEILGEDAGSGASSGDSEGESDSEGSYDDGESDLDVEGDVGSISAEMKEEGEITETELNQLRKTIYLVIMSSLSVDECAHKLMKLNLPEDIKYKQVVSQMIVDTCARETSYNSFYGLLSQRLSKLKVEFRQAYEELFSAQFETVHRLQTNQIRNVAKLFASLFYSDAVSWEHFGIIHLTEADTTSPSRIFIRYFFRELVEQLGMVALKRRLLDPTLAESMAGVFGKGADEERKSSANVIFAINFFTSISLGPLTDELREELKVIQENEVSSSSSSSSSSEEEDSSEIDHPTPQKSPDRSRDRARHDYRRSRNDERGEEYGSRRRRRTRSRSRSRSRERDRERREREARHSLDSPRRSKRLTRREKTESGDDIREGEESDLSSGDESSISYMGTSSEDEKESIVKTRSRRSARGREPDLEGRRKRRQYSRSLSEEERERGERRSRKHRRRQ